jgi:hypothetical protein
MEGKITSVRRIEELRTISMKKRAQMNGMTATMMKRKIKKN